MAFIIFGLPRSRTFWLSRFLTYGDWTCGHEEVRHLRSMDDINCWFSQPCVGTAETSAAPYWRLIAKRNPQVVTVRRPVEEVIDSLNRLPITYDQDILRNSMRRLDAKLDQIETRMENVLRVDFHDLVNEDVCAKVFEHCLPYKHDHDWWANVANLNLQANLPALMQYFRAYEPQITKIAALARQSILMDLMRRPVVEPDGITIQQEDCATFYRDAVPLFKEHAFRVGQKPDAHIEKNLPLFFALENDDRLQIMTARCNGRMFGYLITIITPSLDSETQTLGVNTLFYGSPDIPGIGMKLQRAAISKLKERGIDELILRAGNRGSSTRISAMYRRMGAQLDSELYTLSLG